MSHSGYTLDHHYPRPRFPVSDAYKRRETTNVRTTYTSLYSLHPCPPSHIKRNGLECIAMVGFSLFCSVHAKSSFKKSVYGFKGWKHVIFTPEVSLQAVEADIYFLYCLLYITF